MSIFFDNNDFVGIEVSNTAVRLVQLAKSNGSYNLVSFGSAPLPPNISQSDSKLDMQKIAEIIKQLVKASKVSTKNVATSLPGSSVFTTVIKMPPMSQSELAKAVRFQAEQNIPLKIDDVKIDWQIVRENPTTHELAVMIVAAPNQKIDRLMELFSMADLEVVYIETNAIASSRALSATNDPLFMIVDFGAGTTELAIVENGIVSQVRSLSAAGFALTRSISQGLGLDANQAEQFKQKFGVSQAKLEGQVLKTMKPILTNVTDEIQRLNKFYNEKYGAVVPKVIITGGGSRMPEIVTYMKSALGIEVVFGNPWSKVAFQPNLTEALNSNAPEFACAVGLAMRES